MNDEYKEQNKAAELQAMVRQDLAIREQNVGTREVIVHNQALLNASDRAQMNQVMATKDMAVQDVARLTREKQIAEQDTLDSMRDAENHKEIALRETRKVGELTKTKQQLEKELSDVSVDAKTGTTFERSRTKKHSIAGGTGWCSS